MDRTGWKRLDWWLILCYAIFICWGWANIFSTVSNGQHAGFLDISQKYVRQLLWIAVGLLLIIVITRLKYLEYYRFAGIAYLVSLLSLAGLFLLGKSINGAHSWYVLGSFSLQPSEFAKIATALTLARYLSDPLVEVRRSKNLLWALAIVAIPSLLIIAQPDPGTALVFSAFLLVLYREGMPGYYLFTGFSAVLIFISAQALGTTPVLITMILLSSAFMYWQRKRGKVLLKMLFLLLLATGFLYSSNFIFNKILSAHHRNRIDILIGKVPDDAAFRHGIGYNLNQSLLTIGSGGLTGKGFLKGTLTKGNFVPEQSTDYIFCTIGEEWGFVGSAGLVLLFSLFIARIFYKAERQKNQFSRVYGYSVGCIFMIHLLVNVGMTLGIMPTIGIPLPFFSCGGSSLWSFSIMLFIFIKLDADRETNV